MWVKGFRIGTVFTVLAEWYLVGSLSSAGNPHPRFYKILIDSLLSRSLNLGAIARDLTHTFHLPYVSSIWLYFFLFGKAFSLFLLSLKNWKGRKIPPNAKTKIPDRSCMYSLFHAKLQEEVLALDTKAVMLKDSKIGQAVVVGETEPKATSATNQNPSFFILDATNSWSWFLIGGHCYTPLLAALWYYKCWYLYTVGQVLVIYIPLGA